MLGGQQTDERNYPRSLHDASDDDGDGWATAAAVAAIAIPVG